MSDDIQGPNSPYSNPFAVLIAGGVGGARAARALSTIFSGDRLSVIGNVGDDERLYGSHISPDLDTVVYTLAGIEGPHGWGISGDTFTVMDRLADLGIDTTFRLGDRDLATCLLRSEMIAAGSGLSDATAAIRTGLGVETTVLPVTNDAVRTKVRIDDGSWLDFQDYFVLRGHRDRVTDVAYTGAESAAPAPGVIEAISEAGVVVIAPSNPHLSVYPILAVPGIREAIERKSRVIAISPLFGGRALKGPADQIMGSLGLPPGTEGVLAAYEGLITDLVVDSADADDIADLSGSVTGRATDTRMRTTEEGSRFATWFEETFA
ncbi:MAG: 2-phospho-L-lactate transferase [Actinomycetota bacterium]